MQFYTIGIGVPLCPLPFPDLKGEPLKVPHSHGLLCSFIRQGVVALGLCGGKDGSHPVTSIWILQALLMGSVSSPCPPHLSLCPCVMLCCATPPMIHKLAHRVEAAQDRVH